MSIEQIQTNGCDKLSRVYSDMLNYLQDVMKDEEKLKDLSPLDYSALGTRQKGTGICLIWQDVQKQQ